MSMQEQVDDTQRELGRLDKKLTEVVNELKWLKWLMFLAIVSPKLGGPDPASVTVGVIANI